MKHFEVMMEFLRARLREDEAAARALKPAKNEAVARLRARVLADVEAKWRLMDWVVANQGTTWKAEARGLPAWHRGIVDVIAAVPEYFRKPVIDELVAAYADHPDFRSEWLPIENEQRQPTPSV